MAEEKRAREKTTKEKTTAEAAPAEEAIDAKATADRMTTETKSIEVKSTEVKVNKAPDTKTPTVEDRLIVALDFPTWAEAEGLVHKLTAVKYFKVGLEMYLASRGQAVEHLRGIGKEVFLDLKFHDIPNTVAQACRQAVNHGAAIFNVHAAGGRQMLEQAAQAGAAEALRLGKKRPLLIAVTVLTSLNRQDLQEVGLGDLRDTVRKYAILAQKAGLDGVVASPQEITLIRENCGPDFKIICPGVRPDWSAKGDQKRFLTPHEAIVLGADYLVVGRPITQAPDPETAAKLVMQEIEEALS